MKRYSVVICGGGSTYTPDMIELLCLLQDSFPLRKVKLYDIDAERQKIVGKFGEVMFREYYEGLEFSYTTDPAEAFEDIDFALVQIRAGGMGLRNADEKIPYQYGRIGQETCGPGGLAYGIRSVPAMIQLVKDIRRYSPDAWIINYANPAAIVAEATKRASIRDLGVETVYADNDVHAAYLVELVLSIVNNAMEPALVMTENKGICPNLDPGMMLEATCLAGAQELMPLQVGEVPAFEKGLLENQYACEKLLVDAIFEHSDMKLLQAFTENRLVRDADVAKKIIADFKVANGSEWPEFA